MRKKTAILRLVKNKEFTTKVRISFATKAAGDDFDPHEANYVYTKLNPQTIKAYVSSIAPEKTYWKQYGLAETEIKEIICEDRYKEWFEQCEEIEIDNKKYQVFKYGGTKTAITDRPYKMIRVTVSRKT